MMGSQADFPSLAFPPKGRVRDGNRPPTGADSLSTLVFVYTIVVLCVCLSNTAVSVSAYAVTRRRKYVPQGLFFLAYFIELTDLFGNEWLLQNVGTVNYENYYAIDEPAFRIVVGAVILACLWLIVLDIIDVRDAKVVVVPTVAIIASQTLIVALMPYGPLRQWLFYTMRQVSMIACLCYAYYKYRSNKDEVFRQRMVKRRRLFVVLALLILCILAEDTYVILLAPIPSGDSAFVGVFLSSRNISENVMMCVIAAATFYWTLQDLALRFNQPPEMTPEPSQHNSMLMDHIENRLPAYAEAHGLSKREREILALAVQGKSNREIAGELYLAEGTVKTHLHNIMKKCGLPNREELRKDFWAS